MELPLTQIALWQYISIPVIAAFVGWVTNWAAIKLTFWPVKFKGLSPYLGWQGIIPRKAEKMAKITVEKSVSRLGDMEELLDRVGPDTITDRIVENSDPIVEELVDEVMLEALGERWEDIHDLIKQQAYQMVRQRLPYYTEDIVFDAIDHIHELIDFEDLVVSELVKRPEVLNRIFQESGRQELKFIIRSGLYFGALFGLAQLAVWYFVPQSWVLPFFGFVVGFATNWLALNIIFRPLQPIRIGPFVFQGMFLKRQAQVAETYSKVLAEELITPERIVDTLFRGKREAQMDEFMKQRIDRLINSFSISETVIDGLLGKGTMKKIAQAVVNQFKRRALEPFQNERFVREQAEGVKQSIASKMSRLSPEEFQDVLRPAFQEDEWALILLGASIGLLAGFAQLLFIFN